MPRYFFNMLDDAGTIPDTEGSDLPDLEAARCFAVEAAHDLVSDLARKGDLPLSRAFTVTNESGTVVLTVPFRDAFTLH